MRGRQRIGVATLLAAGALGVFAGSASAATRTVCASGCDFTTIQGAIDDPATLPGDTIDVQAGSYNEDVNVNKQLTLQGDGAPTTTISGPIGGSGSTVTAGAAGVVIDGFKITRDGNDDSTWNDPGLNTAGVSVQGLTNSVEVRNSHFDGNRTAIDVNNSNGNSIHNNQISNNRTGLIFRNQTDSTSVQQNFITGNWTVGVLFLDASGGTNSPLQTAATSTFSNNDISGNWYGQIVDRQSGGSLPLPGLNTKNFEQNWYGTSAPIFTSANSTEPGYAGQIPVAYDGTATPPGGQPDIAGPASGNFDYTPFLWTGTDTDPSTMGFQGDTSQLGVTDNGAQTESSGRIQEAIDAAPPGGTVHVEAGTFDEHVTINKARLDLIGEGASDTIIDPSTDGPAISIAESGTTTDPLGISDLRTTGVTGSGNNGSGIAIVDAPGATTSDILLFHVTSTFNAGHGLAVDTSDALARLELDGVGFHSNGTAGSGDGVRFPTSMNGLDGLTITNSGFEDNEFAGMEIYGPPSTAPVTNVSITGSTFSGNGTKGIYAERLDDAGLDNLTVDGNGATGTPSFAAGIDLNLKKQNFDNIEIENSDITDNATADATNGVGLTIKSRDDGTNGPTTLSDVNVHHNTITGNQRGVRIGEPTKDNLGPTNIHLNKNNISGNTSGGMTNVTAASVADVDAECNWWGAATGPSGSGPGTGDSVGTRIDFRMWLRSSDLNGNCPPEAGNDSGTTNEDNPLVVAAPGVLANDDDFEGTSLTATNASDPPNGSVTLNANGGYTYTPDANYFGPDSFTYTASDGTDVSEPATVSITVNSVNDPPVAVDDEPSTDEDTTLSDNVLTNDTDVANEGQTLTATKLTDPTHGDLTFNPDGSYTYEPDENYNFDEDGPDSFTYEVSDGEDEDTGTVDITVNAVNDPPVANPDSGTVPAGGELNRNAMNGVLSNDTDLAKEDQDLTAVIVDEPDHAFPGRFGLNEDGSYTYSPDTGYTGPDSFTYKANDGEDDSNIVTVSITVTATNGVPLVNDENETVNEDGTLTSPPADNLLANDSDPESEPITAGKESDPSHGTVDVNSDGTYTYTPEPNYHGPDSFTYFVNDGNAEAVATVHITVNPVDDAPTADDDARALNEDSGASALNVRSNDDDIDGDAITVTGVSDPVNGSTSVSGGDVNYTPDPNYCNSQSGASPDTFIYTVNGGDTATVEVTVLCQDDAPVAADDAVTIPQGAAATPLDLTANDPDIDGGPKQVSSATQGTHGTTVVSQSGLTYKPDPPYCNSQPGGTPDTFTYALNGGSQATVAVTVACTGTPSGQGENLIAPVFQSARLTNTTFAVNSRGRAETPVASGQRRARTGTTFVYNLSEPARVVFTIEQKATGRRVGTRCQRPTSRNRKRRRCTRYVVTGRFADAGEAGTNRKAFSGKIGRRTLRPASYRATLVATDSDGNASKVKRLNFRVVRR